MLHIHTHSLAIILRWGSESDKKRTSTPELGMLDPYLKHSLIISCDEAIIPFL